VARRSIEIRTRVKSETMNRVVMNLISNAIKFSPPDETVSIAVRALDAEESSWASGGYQVTIRDQGPGIPAEALDAIFEPYRQLGSAPASSPGTGLGLPISRQFVELLGGRIEVESRPGEGAEFRIVLPTDPAPSAVVFDGIDSGGFEPTRPQLLIVDRDRDRFARLSQATADADLLAVRVDDAAALRRMFGTLRPRAVTLVIEARNRESWAESEAAIRVLSERATPFLLLVVVDEFALALAFGGVLAPDAEEAKVRRALRVLGIGKRGSGRRPLALVAAAREAGVRFGVSLATAGCDHFRIEGEEVRQALGEVTPDLVAADWMHALALAAELALPDAPAARALVLIDAGSASAADLERLVERCADSGESIERALVAGMGRLVAAAPIPPSSVPSG
jgi:anti-sigma regulatory factor (Ser/Thr protein kinase)